jgi:hypothetical protein
MATYGTEKDVSPLQLIPKSFTRIILSLVLVNVLIFSELPNVLPDIHA